MHKQIITACVSVCVCMGTRTCTYICVQALYRQTNTECMCVELASSHEVHQLKGLLKRLWNTGYLFNLRLKFKTIFFFCRIFQGPGHPRELCQQIPSHPGPEAGRGAALLSRCPLGTAEPLGTSSLWQR